MKRRNFLKSLGVAGTGLLLPRNPIFGADAPSNKLNIALIGTWGRGKAHFKAIGGENVVALCDVNEEHLASAAKQFSKAKTYVDWRKMLDQKDIQAVVCCSADHTHAFVANWAMNRGLHVYMEKPLANSVEEARVVRATYLKNKKKLATQVGTQRHAIENFNRVRELVLDGAIGELTDVSAWGNRQLPKPGYLPAEGQPPEHFHFDLWLGPSPDHPYNPDYFSGAAGANCLQWNMYWDFGSGQVGDMGSHTMDLAWNAIDAKLPTTAEAKGDPYNPDVTPVGLTMTFENPANDWRGPIKVSWYQGGHMPESPSPAVDLKKISHGAMFEGTKGTLVADFNNRMLLPFKDSADLTYYKPRTKKTLIPPLGDFQQQWIKACKGSLKTSCDFEYSSYLIEEMLLGLVAYRVGKKINYDGEAGRVTNSPEANELLRRTYRKGWTLDG
jgi:predicted dehydrogenase